MSKDCPDGLAEFGRGDFPVDLGEGFEALLLGLLAKLQHDKHQGNDGGRGGGQFNEVGQGWGHGRLVLFQFFNYGQGAGRPWWGSRPQVQQWDGRLKARGLP